MRCKICLNKVDTKTKSLYHIRWQICGTCYAEIMNSKKKQIQYEERKQNCIICNRELIGTGKLPCCSYGACRGKYYRRIKEINLIKDAIKSHDYSEIKHLSIIRIRELGFDIVVNEGIPQGTSCNE
jgi:hypothetical protein